MYNLLDEPLIRCFYPDGSQRELGIKETFSEASKISRIGGDSDIQEIVLVRLLLAIMYRSLPRVKGIPAWEQTWNSGLPVDEIHEYLELYRDRFELLDSDMPFYQILNAQYTKAQEPHNQFLVLSHQTFSGDDSLYSPFKAQGMKSIDFPFASRQLLELQAFNTASKKSPIQGDTRTKKKGYAQPGWLSNGSVMHSLGKTLEQTLLLNFVPYSVLDIDYEQDLPVWEREPQTAEPEDVHGDMDESRIPDGPADLYTHQSSRVTLYHDGENVTGSVVGIGDRLFKYNLSTIEPMMAWRQILRETKEIAFVPVKQVEGKDSWRSLNAFLGHNDMAKFGQNKPRILEWLDNTNVREVIQQDLGGSIPTCVTSVFYGPQDATINHKDVSILDISTDILHDEGIAATNALKGLKIVEKQVFAFSCLIANLLVAEGKEKSPAKGTKASDIAKNGTHEILRILGVEYREWISQINNENAEKKLFEWNERVFNITKKFGNELTENASSSAISGRKIGENPMNAAVASNIFMGTLFKEFKIERKESE